MVLPRGRGGTKTTNAFWIRRIPLLLFLCCGIMGLLSANSFFGGYVSDDGSSVIPLQQPDQIERNTTTANNLAYSHSFGLFDDVTDHEWKKLQARTLSMNWYANPDEPLEGVDDPPRWTKMNMNSTFDCPRMEGVGEGGQRTKLVCNPKRLSYKNKDVGGVGQPRFPFGASNCLIYSVGSAGDYVFEDDIARMHSNNCEIHVFDPANWTRPGDTIEKNIHYHVWGLSSTYDDSKSVVWPKGRGGGFKTFPETLETLGHIGRTIDILKIDCEGCEWSSIDDWIHLGIRQILIETHGVPSPRGTPNQRWYKKPMDVSEYYNKFSNRGYALYSKDIVNELVLELSFIKFDDDFWKGYTSKE